MNRKTLLLGLLLIPMLSLAQNQDIGLGKISFPKAFIHSGQEFPAGEYEVVLKTKDALPFFYVYDLKQELLFEELAIVRSFSGRKMTTAFRLQKDFLKGEEYFRIKVIRPDQWLLGYFLVKQ